MNDEQYPMNHETFLRNMTWVGLGGAVGSMLRYGIGLFITTRTNVTFPLATLSINIVGSFLIGVLFGLSLRNAWLAGNGWHLLAAGLCGGFTTFSAFSLENVRMLEAGELLKPLLYAALSVFAGIGCCYLGKLTAGN